MTYLLIIIAEAQKDIQKAFDYYFEINRLLSQHFIHSLEVCYDKLQEHPYNYSFFGPSKELRSLDLDKFPYSLVYKITDNKVFIAGLYNRYQKQENILKRKIK